MPDDAKDAERLAQLEAEVAALKAAQPKPQPSREEQERATAEWIDRMHQMREGRMSAAMPPSVHQYFADGVTPADCADLRQQTHRPTGRPSMIPTSPQPTNVRGSAGDGKGYVEPRPLTNPPGTNWVDAIAIADEVRQRAELKRKLGEG